MRAWPARVRETVGDEVAAFTARIEAAGWTTALSQKMLQLAGPGVPDVYQGTELWDLSLVDPDNRREVDYAARRELLSRVAGGWVPPLDSSGAAKLLVTHRVLGLRRERPELFAGYRALLADGSAADHAVAFARHRDLVVVATRMPVGLERRPAGWDGTVLNIGLDVGDEAGLSLDPGAWTDVLTGRQHAGGVQLVADLLATYPVALLLRT